MVCVSHYAGYVARVTMDWQREDGSWSRSYQRNFNLGDNQCTRGDHALRVKVEGHTGFNWRDTCEITFDRGQSGTVTIKGTSLHQRCDRW